MLKWFLTGPDKPRIQDKAVVKKMYHTARVQAVTAMILGYGMYYVMRMTLGVANKLLEPYAGAVLGKIILLLAIILFIQKRPRGLFALKGRAVEA